MAASPKYNYEAELKRIENALAEIRNKREQASEMIQAANKAESSTNIRIFKVLSTELLKRGIDPTDVEFIIKACVAAKQKESEAKEQPNSLPDGAL